MFAWWWLVVMFIIGAIAGAAIVIVCTLNKSDLENARKWEDE